MQSDNVHDETLEGWLNIYLLGCALSFFLVISYISTTLTQPIMKVEVGCIRRTFHTLSLRLTIIWIRCWTIFSIWVTAHLFIVLSFVLGNWISIYQILSIWTS